ncbi:GRB2-associated-binding protein 3-like [Hydractinia symbiolongicarpus]|uniref:GRB2-associated-binding protein 3-like n=1 Tax=Hydractinia symbiolongicarpus TaxID=13093 RepID=UPI00254B9D43|nr:GRB2-associated-binding protein 3-like [Hydractinia symbiolongicarpus]
MSAKNNEGKLGDVLMEDWMIKSPPVEKLQQLQSWRRRYFALLHINHKHTVPHNWSKKGSKSLENLHDVYLVYWKDDKDRKNGVKPIKTIPILKNYTVSECKPPCFETTHHHVILLDTIERKFYLCADTEKAGKKWLKELLNAIESTLHVDAGHYCKEHIYEVIRNIMIDVPSRPPSKPPTEHTHELTSKPTSELKNEPTSKATSEPTSKPMNEATTIGRRNPSTSSSLSSNSESGFMSGTALTLSEEKNDSFYVPMVPLKEKNPPPRPVTEAYQRVPPRENGKKPRRTRSLHVGPPLDDHCIDKRPVPFLNEKTVSKILIEGHSGTIFFLNTKLEVSHLKSIENLEDGIKVTTSECQCVLTKIKQT